MVTKLNQQSPGLVEVAASLNAKQLAEHKQAALKNLRRQTKVPGFRAGNAPLDMVERHVDQAILRSAVLEAALQQLYGSILDEHALEPINDPRVEIKNYTPNDSLSVVFSIDVLPAIRLHDYTKVRAKQPLVRVTDKDVGAVLENLRDRVASRQAVERAAKEGDELTIDFRGFDIKGQSLAGAKAEGYRLALGSDTFIPGFEKKLVGAKAGEQRKFELTFPKDYPQKALAGKKARFEVAVKMVSEVSRPALNDGFARAASPFKTLDELKSDIRKQLTAQRQHEAEDDVKDTIVGELVAKSTVPVPDTLLNDQVEVLRRDLLQNLAYRGITLTEYLKQRGLTEEELAEKELKPQAARRIQASLVLREVAKKEGIEINESELSAYLHELKQRFPSQAAEFDTEEQQRDAKSRLMTIKTLDRLYQLATTKSAG